MGMIYLSSICWSWRLFCLLGLDFIPIGKASDRVFTLRTLYTNLLDFSCVKEGGNLAGGGLKKGLKRRFQWSKRSLTMDEFWNPYHSEI